MTLLTGVSYKKFLEDLGEMKRGKAKVSWESLCMPKQEGDLGVAEDIINQKVSSSPCVLLEWKWQESFILVADIVENGTWKWPLAWYDMFPILNQIAIPNIDENKQDSLFWKNINETLCEFSVRNVWVTIRVRQDKVPWFRIVWSPFSIPRHTFHMWLVMERKLKTHDKLRQWDVGNLFDLNMLRCPLCKSQPNTHEHLLFKCVYSSQIWM
ncbi:reverse transcriptase domain, reverse transcriptase zinc-binding domain protein [Tanacetum coccineum]